MAANVEAASAAQRAELVRLLVEGVTARDARVDQAGITCTPRARPFFGERWFECPQGGSGTRPLSDDDDPLAWYVA